MNLSENYVFQKNLNRNAMNIKNGEIWKEQDCSKDLKAQFKQNLTIKIEPRVDNSQKK